MDVPVSLTGVVLFVQGWIVGVVLFSSRNDPEILKPKVRTDRRILVLESRGEGIDYLSSFLSLIVRGRV